MELSTAFARLEAECDGHRFAFTIAPEARLAQLIDAVDAARRRLRLYFYRFADGVAARAMAAALIAARARGVEVTLLVDGFGTDDQDDAVYAGLIDAGVVFARFFPRYGRRYLIRNHQKMLIADEAQAIIGGCNIEDSYFFEEDGKPAWHDLMMRIEGDAVGRLAAYYDALAAWMASRSAGLISLNALLARHSEQDGAVRWLFGGPSRRLNPLARSLRSDIAKARRIDMVQAYFAPNWGFLRKLGRVAARGGFRLVAAAQSDNYTTVAAARHCFRRLLRKGAEISEFLPARLHVKLSVVDDAVYIGSANFDMRSLYLNTEIALRIEDAALAAQMRELVAAHVDVSEPITREAHRARSGWFARLRWLAAYLVITTLDYRIARNLNWRQD